MRICNFWSNNYIESESNNDRNKTLSIGKQNKTIVNPNQGGSYMDSPDWIKNKQATINLMNKKDNKCFQYTVTVALNHEKIEKNS